MDTTPPKEDESSYDICVACEHPSAGIDPEPIVRAIRKTLEAHQRPACRLSVALVDDATMTELHARYLTVREPTDVLTFDLHENDPEVIDAEIVISLDAARRESDQRRHQVADELLLYAIHGTLHLLGYDDHSAGDAEVMHAREDELLTALGVGPIFRGTEE